MSSFSKLAFLTLCLLPFIEPVLGLSFWTAEDCHGYNRYVTATVPRRCYGNMGDAAWSIEARYEYWRKWRAHKRGTHTLCGALACQVQSGGSPGLGPFCCTSRSGRNIKGAKYYELTPVRPPPGSGKVRRSLTLEDLPERFLDAMEESNSTWSHLNPPSYIEQLPEDECVDIQPISETFIDLPDGTYYGLGYGVWNMTEEELLRQLSTKGKPNLSPAKIDELRQGGVLV